MVHISNNSSVVVTYSKLLFDFGNKMWVYSFHEIKQISILTTEERLLNDKVFLVFEMVNETYIMGITHPDFQEVLFRHLTELFELDHGAVIDAMQSSNNHNFVLYRK